MARRTLDKATKEGILQSLAAGVSPVTIAAQYKVSIPTVYNYKNRSTSVATESTETVENSTGC